MLWQPFPTMPMLHLSRHCTKKGACCSSAQWWYLWMKHPVSCESEKLCLQKCMFFSAFTHTHKKKKSRKKDNIPPLPHRQEFLASGNINIALSLKLILICFKTATSMSTECESHCFYTMCDTRGGKRTQVFPFSSLMHKSIIFFLLENWRSASPRWPRGNK